MISALYIPTLKCINNEQCQLHCLRRQRFLSATIMPEAPAARPRVGSLSNNSSGNRTSLFSSFLGKPATPKQERPQSAGGRQQQQQPQQQQPQQPVQSGANEFGAAPRQSMQPEPQPLHGELKSAVNLTQSHARKVYFSGPMVQRIERGSDGNRPAKDEGWKDVWAQLSGTTFSVWDMRAIEEASRQNREVPPKYINITDAVRHTLYLKIIVFDADSACI